MERKRWREIQRERERQKETRRGREKSLRKKGERESGKEREGERNKESVTRLFSHEMRSDGCRPSRDLSKERLKVSQIELS